MGNPNAWGGRAEQAEEESGLKVVNTELSGQWCVRRLEDLPERTDRGSARALAFPARVNGAATGLDAGVQNGL